MSSRTLLRSAALILLILAGCGADRDPSVQRIEGSAATPVGVEAWTIHGQRDGARTRAVTTWSLEDGETLRLDLLFAYDPSPVLEEGRWLSESGTGSVKAESVRFVGGQGEGPSVGGSFVLYDGPDPRFRVQLPLTRIETPTPAP